MTGAEPPEVIRYFGPRKKLSRSIPATSALRGAQGEFRPNPSLAYLLGCMNSMLAAAGGKQT